MVKAKLIKELERQGFFLEFPKYDSREVLIIDILKENNPRITLSLVLFLMDFFDYSKIVKKINNEQKKELDKAIIISEKIYLRENIENSLREIMKENKIVYSYRKKDFETFYDIFKEAEIENEEKKQELIKKQTKLRLNLDLNKSLSVLFSPAKIRIMSKIFNHENLTNTELKYYYKAISNINKAVLNPNVWNYLRMIELSKKIRK